MQKSNLEMSNSLEILQIWRDRRLITGNFRPEELKFGRHFMEDLAIVVVKHGGHKLNIDGIALGRKVCKKAIVDLAVQLLREYEALMVRNSANYLEEPVIDGQVTGHPPLDSYYSVGNVLSAKQQAIVDDATTHQNLLRALAQGPASAAANVAVFVLDIEWYDRDSGHNQRMLEAGFSLLAPVTSSNVKRLHFIIEENYNLRNTKVADNKDNFLFGESVRVSTATAGNFIKAHVQGLQRTFSRVILVGHTIESDIAFLISIGVDLSSLERIDIAKVRMAQQSNPQPTGLENLAIELRLSPRFLHNGGNDSWFTMWVFIMFIVLQGSSWINVSMD
jgi:hypothetical protein